MTHHYLSHTIFLGCMLVVSAGFAQAEIVKCVDETATVTYTDARCKGGANVARTSALINPPPVRARVSSPARTFAAEGKARKAVLVKGRADDNRKTALDVTTLKMARSSMLLNDQASSLLRQQKLAALDQRGQRWFNF